MHFSGVLIKMARLFLSGVAFFVASVSFVAFSKPAFAQIDCGLFEGAWAGGMEGQYYNGDTHMTIANCRVRWVLPDGRTNKCRFKERAGNIEYSCSLGSRGVVQLQGNKITMQNVYTARKHGAYTVNVTRSN